MLLEELRKMSTKFKSKEELKRQKLVKKYEIKISNELRKKVMTTGKISINTLVPNKIYRDIISIFRSKGFEVIFLGCFSEGKVKLIIQDDKKER